MIMFEKVSKKQLQNKEVKKEHISRICNEIMDIIQRENCSLSDMSNIFINLQLNFNAMLIDIIKEKK